MSEMQRLVQDDQLRVSSIRTWRDITPRVIRQAQVEAVHNSRLREATSEIGLDDEGIVQNVTSVVMICTLNNYF